ncbi:MAG: exodeoxyribonuclease small subunit [Verrucomicrobiota bacterium]
MPNAPKNAVPAAKDVPFEEALTKLESIVETMESGDLPLDAMLARFEEGVQLAQTCQKRLEEAELKIQRLERNTAGEPALKPAPDLIPDDE